jgi:hypothetical protein
MVPTYWLSDFFCFCDSLWWRWRRLRRWGRLSALQHQIRRRGRESAQLLQTRSCWQRALLLP